MPLPNNFSRAEQLQDCVKRTLNPEIGEWFREVTEDDLSTPRGQLRVACTHHESDTMEMTLCRMLMFYDVVGAFPHQSGYIMPDRQVFQMEGNPQVIILFAETEKSRKARKAPRRDTMRCSFRLLKEDFASAADETKIDQLERKLRLAFQPNWSHQTGQINYTYVDKAHGFQLRIPAYRESDARELTRKLIDCSLDNSIAWKEAAFSEASKKKPGKPTPKRVLGKSVKQNERRPTAVMKLRQADLFIPGWGSRTLIYRNLV